MAFGADNSYCSQYTLHYIPNYTIRSLVRLSSWVSISHKLVLRTMHCLMKFLVHTHCGSSFCFYMYSNSNPLHSSQLLDKLTPTCKGHFLISIKLAIGQYWYSTYLPLAPSKLTFTDCFWCG